MRRVVVPFLFVLAAGAGIAGEAEPSVAVRSGASIVYSSDRSSEVDHGQVDAIDPSGTRIRRLVSDAFAATWSPDGKMLAFSRPLSTPDQICPDAVDLHVVRADGRGERRLSKDTATCAYPYRGYMSWSPDSSKIAFVRQSSGTSEPEIWTVAVAGGKMRLLAGAQTPASSIVSVAWSPNGHQVAFVERAEAPSLLMGLYLVDADGTGRRLIGRGTDSGSGPPSWAPDGAQLVYDSGSDGIRILDVRTGSSRRLRLPLGVSYPAWSPDGRWIAIGGAHGVLLAKPTGKGLRQLVPSSYAAEPAWSPDSKSIAIEGQGGTNAAPGPVTDRGPSDIWVLPVDGRQGRRATQGWRYGTTADSPMWQPASLPLARLRGPYVPPGFASSSVQVGQVLDTTHPVSRLAADGSRVALAFGAGAWNAGRSEVWNPESTELTVFGHGRCPSPYDPCLGIAIAGNRIGQLSIISAGSHLDGFDLTTATLTAPRMDFGQGPICGSGWQCLGVPIGDLIGKGSLLVFDTWSTPCQRRDPGCTGRPKTDGRLFRLDGTQAVQIASSAGALTPLSVDVGRILVDHEDGTMDIRTRDGTVIRSLSFNASAVKGAGLQGNDLVVQTQTAIEVSDANSGVFQRRWALPAADATLTDLHGGIAVLVAGTDIHLLRLSDGHDAVIHAPGAAPVLADLESAGLYYSYTVSDTKYPGRVVFVPNDKLPLH